MKKLFIIAAAAACVLTVSCKHDPIPAEETDEIVFTASDAMSAEVTTKAASPVNSLQSTGFYASATTGSDSESVLWNNAPFVYDSGQYTGGKYWPLTNNGIHFYASNKAITFNESGCSVEGISAKTNDVVCAYLSNPTWKVRNELTFEHVFSRVGTVTAYGPTGYTVTSFSIRFTPYIEGNYNIKTGQWSNLTTDSSSATKTIATAISSENSNDLWIIPGTYTLTASYTLSKGSGAGSYTESITKTAEVTLEAGKINNIQTTLPSGNATDIAFDVTVTPWSNNSITAEFTTPEP